ncbi:WD40 repeat-like protein [Punctularia strigosozonata HHB-11173 SS5]|uniref:WD40 repeat-like protein n=1 Tax=Punctularia strigosozonata (strain HHB-11173) TaxID=741275 RepID=UPI0004417281|nr:WD40 repeat-like protein [Punctularia strigosozonata HHB-11173 SS5]EIN10351.1 WD40 repeat-like protein [Punctularia strigosozonata HHB-11173 SS5]
MPTPKSAKRPLREIACAFFNVRQPQRKKMRLMSRDEEKTAEDEENSDADWETDSDFEISRSPPRARTRKRTVHNALDSLRVSLSHTSSRNCIPSTRPILASFASHHTCDAFYCRSLYSGDLNLTPPYVCAYTHAAKRGTGRPLLAIGTEQGSLHLVRTPAPSASSNTSSSRWMHLSPPLTHSWRAHMNGLFDAAWRPDDARLATASADASVRIWDPSRVTASPVGHLPRVLSEDRGAAFALHNLTGHAGTVKCVAWSPGDSDVLASGGRGGEICIWDLRLASGGAGIVAKIWGAGGGEVTRAGRPKRGGGSVTGVVIWTRRLTIAINSVLRNWDIRYHRRTSTMRGPLNEPTRRSDTDPTLLTSRRPRALTALASGFGLAADLLFGVGADSRVHAYDRESLAPLSHLGLRDPRLRTGSFYVRAATSPCGRWVACGSAGGGFVWDFAAVRKGRKGEGERAVRVCAQAGEVGAMDWAAEGGGTLAMGADDGTVRMWRPDWERRAEEHGAEEFWARAEA